MNKAKSIITKTAKVKYWKQMCSRLIFKYKKCKSVLSDDV